MRTSTLTFALLLTAFAITAAPGFAQGTPDFLTPSVESVCDTEFGAAYGLCVARCEAMDCDSGPHASNTACGRVEGRFEQITGYLPACAASACPCVGALTDFASTLVTDDITHCVYDPAVSDGEGGVSSVTAVYLSNGDFAAVAEGASDVCAFVPANGSPAQSLGITAEEASACAALLEQVSLELDMLCEVGEL